MSEKQKYIVKTGMNYDYGDNERRAEPGDVVDDLPAESVPWLLEQGHIAECTVPSESREESVEGVE
ncbi:MAG TPA: hypothetical protein VFA21_20550 [Pyrinomonadaceae bacterium]|jgi:hypothetical protein|nr:hypothetical protein [Pyrinomonadaceae bacterium]